MCHAEATSNLRKWPIRCEVSSPPYPEVSQNDDGGHAGCDQKHLTDRPAIDRAQM